MTKKPLLIMFLGVTGSGKSYFARQLAAKIGAVRLNGDSMRLALFKTPEAVEARHSDPTTNPMTFGAIDYAAGQILLAGCSVIYDAHHNRQYPEKFRKISRKT
jgi:predicted kinase